MNPLFISVFGFLLLVLIASAIGLALTGDWGDKSASTDLVCMEVDIGLTMLDQNGMRATAVGKAALCAEEWWLSSFVFPDLSDRQELEVRPWTGPKITQEGVTQ